MSIFTGRELEFLAGLNRSWRSLYWRELACLCGNKDAAPNAEQDAASARSNGLVRRGEATEADADAVLHRRVELAVANR